MIVHSISPYRPFHLSPKEEKIKFKGKIGSKEHKDYAFDHAFTLCKFNVGETLMFDGQEVILIDIEKDPDKVSWIGMRPMICEIWDYNENTWMVHPRDLSKKFKRN